MIEALGLLIGFGTVPCMLLGIIMLISFLTCDYIEKFVVKTFCSIKNKRRRFRENSSSLSKRRKKSSSTDTKSKTEAHQGATPGTSRSASSHEAFQAPPSYNLEQAPPPPYHEGRRGPGNYEEPPPSYSECSGRVPTKGKAKCD